MEALNLYQEQDIIFIDIETVRGSNKLTEGDPMYDAWLYKARYGNELSTKTGQAITPEEFYDQKAALYAPFAQICCISIGKITDNTIKMKSFVGSEKELLKSFIAVVNATVIKIPNTLFCGFQSTGFDLPFIVKRMIVNDIEVPRLLDVADKKPWEIRQLDLSTLWKGQSFYPDSLIAVSCALGLASPKQGIDGSQVSDEFYKGNIEGIAHYCEGDVLTTINVYRKFRRREALADPRPPIVIHPVGKKKNSKTI